MNSVRKGFMWLFMLNKRLYKKPSFILILVFIVILTVAMTLAAEQENGVVTVSLFTESHDGLAEEIINDLIEQNSIISFKRAESLEDAYSSVSQGRADASWIFPPDLQQRIDSFAGGGNGSVVTMVERDETVFLRLAREKLYSTIFPYISYSKYRIIMSDEMEETDSKVLREYYDSSIKQDSIINIVFSNSDQKIEDVNYLTTPLRGVLSIAVILCSLASVMYFMQDRQNGLLSRISPIKHMAVECGYVFISSVNSAAFVLIALLASGMFTSFANELIHMLLYVIMCVVFSVFCGEICRKISLLGSVIPALILMMLALCPVFINVRRTGGVQYIFPPYYYLMVQNNIGFLPYILIYIFAVAAMLFAFNFIKNKSSL